MNDGSQPLLLVVAGDAAKYAGLPATIDVATTAPMAKMNLHGARLLRQHYDAVLVDERVGDMSGYDMVQMLRHLCLHDGAFYLVAEPMSSLNVDHAQQVGALVVGADHHSLVTMLAKLGSPKADVAVATAAAAPPTLADKLPRTAQFSEAPFVPQVINAMREFLASEAEPRVKSLYQELLAQRYPDGVSFDELVGEAARHLLDDLDDRRAFVSFVRVQQSRNK